MPTLNLRALAAIGAGLIILGLLAWIYVLGNQRDAARAGWEAEKTASALFAERVKNKALELSRRIEAYTRRVEADQTRVTQEVNRDYQIRLAELRAAYERLLRERGTNPGRPSPAPGLPRVPDAPRGPDGAAGPDGLSLAERLLASEQALRLLFLQDWVRQQQAVQRGPVPVE